MRVPVARATAYICTQSHKLFFAQKLTIMFMVSHAQCLVEIMQEAVEQRTAAVARGSHYEDLLQRTIDARDETGNALSADDLLVRYSFYCSATFRLSYLLCRFMNFVLVARACFFVLFECMIHSAQRFNVRDESFGTLSRQKCVSRNCCATQNPVSNQDSSSCDFAMFISLYVSRFLSCMLALRANLLTCSTCRPKFTSIY